MNSHEVSPAGFEAAWRYSPWGMAAIDSEGSVCAVNPVFNRLTGLTDVTVLGMSEATLDAWLGARELVHRRIAVTGGEFRALYYLCDLPVGSEGAIRLSQAAELLREPLASVYGFAELLLTQSYDEETRRDLMATLLSQVEAMYNIINEHLELGGVR
ncbi:MAG: PAS domain S-box protein [Pseudomonadota bacterium]